MKKIIESKDAPKAVGPYSQAIQADNLLFVSGQLPIDPKTNEMPSTIEQQTRMSLDNLKAVLSEAGCDMSDVVKTTVLLQNISDFGTMNEIYAKYFTGECPARMCYEVAALPKGALVEIDAIAIVNKQ